MTDRQEGLYRPPSPGNPGFDLSRTVFDEAAPELAGASRDIDLDRSPATNLPGVRVLS